MESDFKERNFALYKHPLNTSWPLLPITLGFTMNERQKLVSVACVCPGKRNSCVRTSYHVSKMLHHTGSAIRTLIN